MNENLKRKFTAAFSLFSQTVAATAAKATLFVLEDSSHAQISEGGSSSKKPKGNMPESSDGGSASTEASAKVVKTPTEESDCILVEPEKSPAQVTLEKPEPKQVEHEKSDTRFYRNPKLTTPACCIQCNNSFKKNKTPCEYHILSTSWICMLCMKSCTEGIGERCDECQNLFGIFDVFNPFATYEVSADQERVALRLVKKNRRLNFRVQIQPWCRPDRYQSFQEVPYEKSDFQEENLLAYLNKHARTNVLDIYGTNENDPLGTETYVFSPVKSNVTIKFFLEGLATGRPVRPVVTVHVRGED